jgi:hypothetical protein
MLPIHHGVLFNHKKKMKSCHPTTWIEQEIIMSSEIAQPQKDSHVISLKKQKG